MKKLLVNTLFSFFVLAFLHPLSSLNAVTVHSEQNYPEKFLLSDLGYVPECKNQGDRNTCWTFSTFAAIESKLLQKNIEADFSEKYLSFAAYTDFNQFYYPKGNDIFSNGGSQNIASAVLTRGEGFTYEKYIGYDDTIFQIEEACDFLVSNSVKPDYVIKDIDYIMPWLSPKLSYSESQLKNYILGTDDFSKADLSSVSPVIISCTMDRTFFNTSTNSICCDTEYSYIKDKSLHSALIIGWDDTYSKENFNELHRPEHDGAWCVWSSGGDKGDSGKGGILWISYEDTSVSNAVIYSSVGSNIYKKVYQHDYYGWSTSLTADFFKSGNNGSKKSDSKETEPAGNGKMANMFLAADTEVISAVGLYTISENVSYEISIGTDINMPESAFSPASPVNCRCITEAGKGIIQKPGYHVIELDKKVPVDKSSHFSVIVRITDNNSRYIFPVEAKITKYAAQNSYYASQIQTIDGNIGQNQSFVYDEAGDSWTDISGLFTESGNYPWHRYEGSLLDTWESLPYPELRKEIYKMEVDVGNLCIKAFSEEILPGDINFDNTVNASDIAEIQQLLLSDDEEAKTHKYYDINKDAAFNIYDLVSLVKIVSDP